jgi:D-aminoacyl-tRNA deacylase
MQRIALISSRQDEAGKNIRNQILALQETGQYNRTDARFTLHEVQDRLIWQDGIDREVEADLIIFLSRHTSARPRPLLSVHVTGNLLQAELGGAPRSFPPASPAWMKAVLFGLQVRAPSGYQVTYEVTHHGPTELETPSFFVEIGSTGGEWRNPIAGRVVAESVLTASPEPVLPLLGLGGNHYATRATEIAFQSRAAFGHIIPSREVPELDAMLLEQGRERSGAVAAYIDRKALSPNQVRDLEHLLEEIGLPVVTEREIRQIGDLSWVTYQSIREQAESLAPGSRPLIGTLRGNGDLVVVEIDQGLLTEAIRANRAALLQQLEALPGVSFMGVEGGILPFFLSYNSRQSELINHLIRSCVTIIIGNQNTSIDGDTLFIHTLRFDPHKARALGIPKGPHFGRLSEGQTIEHDGRMITPEMVQTETTRTLHIPGLERYV